MQARSVLVVTNKIDPHADAVIDHLSRLAVPVVRLHPDEIGTGIAVSIRNSSSQVNIGSNRRSFIAEDLAAVWFRRPLAAGTELPTSSERKFAAREGVAAIREIIRRAPGLIVSHPDDMEVAADKLMQLDWARRAGLNVPEYLLSNEVSLLLEFCKIYQEVVAKPISPNNAVVETEDEVICLMTQAVNREHLLNLGGDYLKYPLFLQELIPRQADIRLTCIGGELYAVAIHSGVGPVDSRDRWLKSPHQIISIPDSIAGAVLDFLREYQLQYAAFDFILSPEGKWWFLECNPNGQFLWLENLTGLPLSRSMANLLSSKTH
jgi:hypothetical protein